MRLWLSIVGLGLVTVALLTDAAIGNLQERAMCKYSSTQVEMLIYSFSIGTLYILTYLLIDGASLVNAFTFFSKVLQFLQLFPSSF